MSDQAQAFSAAIIGASGYTGAELARLLSDHPAIELAMITSRKDAGRRMSEFYPSLRGFVDLPYVDPQDPAVREQLLAHDILFFATPHGVAQGMLAEFGKDVWQPGGPLIVDLSADFRITDIELWERWYGQAHQAPQLVETAVYGLPELHREKLKTARLIACAGCYPTSVQLGLAPLVEQDLVDCSTLIANSASGITGAGRKADLSLLFTENSDSFRPYAVSGHRHQPEIEQGLSRLSAEAGHKRSVTIDFVPHLLPAHRGILSTIYARVGGEMGATGGRYQALFEERYADEPFVDVLPAGSYPETRAVRGSNRLQISVTERPSSNLLVIHVAEDNLCKGASGQAIQCANLALGLEETLGLTSPAMIV